MSFYFLEFSQENFPYLRTLGSFQIDNPKLKDNKEIAKSIFFSGWFSFNAEISIEVFIDGKLTNLFFLNKNRPDVKKALNLDCSDLLGIQFKIPLKGKLVEFFLKIGVESFLILRLSKPADVDSIRLWNRIHENHNGELCEFKSISNDSLVEFKDYLSSFYKPLQIYELYEVIFSREEIDCDLIRFTNFVNDFKRPEWALDLVSRLKAGDEINIPSYEKNKLFTCVGSFLIHDYNYLLFSDGVINFYIVQHTRNVAIIFPLHGAVNLYIEPWFKGSIHHLFEVLNIYIKLKNANPSILNFKPSHYGGLNVSHYRPYHFFYDVLNGLECFYRNNANIDVNIYSVNGADFIRTNHLFPNLNSHRSVDFRSFSFDCFLKNKVLVSPSLQYISDKDNYYLKSLSEKLLNISCISKNDYLVFFPDDYDLVVWIGISSDKRSWIEQEEGFYKIFKKLSESYKKILVYADGRTYPVNPTTSDVAVAEKDSVLVNKLKNQLELLSIDVQSLVGMNLLSKIGYGKYIDFFITSHGTDSIVPSCILEKPGITYVSNEITTDQKSMHLHYKILEVDPSKLHNVLNANGLKKSWHETSISMDWHDVYECVLQLIDKYKIRK